ncbi:MAG: NAD(P)H-hydrate dehydratase [Bacteroidales bacterium]|nr:NAD(P)H-hydrate dehydratase [Bacteroidales bacterium]
MQKIFTVDKIRLADQFTIENEPISSIDLMERAATACVNWISERIENTLGFAIFCGPGNNGGDGLAIARLLIEKEYRVRVFVLQAAKYSTDFNRNKERLENKLEINSIENENDFPAIQENELIIDALFGSGLSKPLSGISAKLIAFLNDQKALRIAIDIASGLYADKSSMTKNTNVFKPDYTLSFQFPKLAFFMPENDTYVGDWQVLDIGLSSKYIQSTETPFFFNESSTAKELIRPRAKYAHKGTYGHALLIAGSIGKMGAAVLAGKAALRSGAGLVSVHHPKSAMSIIPTAVPELMTSLDGHEEVFSKTPRLDPYSAIAIGPGLGIAKPSQSAFKILIQESKLPLIIDADALNMLAENKTWLSFLPPQSILTPHLKEFERLDGKAKNDFDCLDKQIAFAKKHQVYLILKGAHTRIATPEGLVLFNSTGNPGMATGGSGDVLTGILLGLKAQNYSSLQASILGVFLHGLAGDFAAENKGEASLIAGDIIDFISEAFLSIQNME